MVKKCWATGLSIFSVQKICMFIFFRYFFWLVAREKRAQLPTILLAQMQLTSQEVAKVLLES